MISRGLLLRRVLALRPPTKPPLVASSSSSSPSSLPYATTFSPPHLLVFRRGAQSESKLVRPLVRGKNDDPSPKSWNIKMLYDGDCPLCMREVNMLRERNNSYGTIKFVDISSKDYCPEDNQGLDYKTVMGRIHAIESNGTVVTDVEAFRRLYEEVGLGWVYAITKYQFLERIANAIYGFWAKYRLQITGRPPLEEILESRGKNLREACKDDKVCKM